MGALIVRSPGLHSTIQALPRSGVAWLGVAPGGAADPLSWMLGNRLVGGAAGAAVEMTLVGGVFEFESHATIAITGGATMPILTAPGGSAGPITTNAPVRVRAGERLTIGPIASGARAYLCVEGGVDVPEVLGSRSTHIAAGFGGLGGRALRTGDRLAFQTRRSGASVAENVTAVVEDVRRAVFRRELRALPGPHADRFSAAAMELFWSSEFCVSNRSDRVGLRLDGPRIESPAGGRMVSEGVTWGAVQIPEDGRPIILGCDHPTTGGYPVIACVASVDLPALGQLRPGDTLGLLPETRSNALRALRQQRARLGVLFDHE
ncbi:MAG: biotin-dependent carboxyltransferase family protein [Phycisphaerales bacterium]